MPLAAPAPAKRNGSQSLDLKWSLTLRVVAVAVVCFLVASAVALYGTYRELRQANDAVADVVAQQLQMQLFRIDSNIDLPARFPDWGPVIDRVQGAGQCIEYVKPDGSNGHSSCVGVDGSDEAAPAWFSWLGSRLLTEHTDSVRHLSYRGKDSGTLVVTTKTSVVIAAIWKRVSGLLGLTALLVVAICLLQFVAISRALRPTKDILAALDRLARGDLSHRLPRFFDGFKELLKKQNAELARARRYA
jgi:two-component system, NarL family, sensor histidine kinase UhpB